MKNLIHIVLIINEKMCKTKRFFYAAIIFLGTFCHLVMFSDDHESMLSSKMKFSNIDMTLT